MRNGFLLKNIKRNSLRISNKQNKNFAYKENTLIIMILGLVPGILFFTLNAVGIKLEYFPGDLGDGRLNLYFLEHAHSLFAGKLDSFWNAPFMFPEKNVLAFSDNLLGSAPVYSLYRFFGFDIYRSYQLWYISISVLNYIAAFYFLKYIFKNDYSAVLGAFVFAFSIALQSQMSHAQTFPRYAIPIALLFAVKFKENLKPEFFFLTLLFVVYQIYCGIYLGFMLAIPVAIFILITIIPELICNKKISLNFKWYLKVIASVIVNLAILIPLMLPYMERKISPSYEHYIKIMISVPTLISHIFSKEGSLIWDFLNTNGQNYELYWNHMIFAGGIATISLLISFFITLSRLLKNEFRIRKLSTTHLLLLTGLLTIILYLRFYDYSAYISIYYIPGFSAIRSLARIINIELLFFAIATSYLFTHFLRQKLKYQQIIFLLLLILLICDNYFFEDRYHKTSVAEAKARTALIEESFAKIPKASVVSYEPYELKSKSIYYHLDAMLMAQKYQLKTINGYSADSPRYFNLFWSKPDARFRTIWLGKKEAIFSKIYVVKETGLVEQIAFNEIRDSFWNIMKEMKIQDYINYIRSDKKWMEMIEVKAKEKNIPIDSMLRKDAKWAIRNRK